MFILAMLFDVLTERLLLPFCEVASSTFCLFGFQTFKAIGKVIGYPQIHTCPTDFEYFSDISAALAVKKMRKG